MTRDEALRQLRDNPNATFNPQIAAKMIAAMSRVDIDVIGLRSWLQRNDGECVTQSRIREMSRRPTSRLPSGV